MFTQNNKLEKQIIWARENVPALAAYDDEAVAKIVKRVSKKTQGLQVALSLGFSFFTAFVSTVVHDELRANGAPEFERYVVTVASVMLGALLGTIIGNSIFLRRLENEVSGF